MSINICKECGKQFEAASARVAYCSDIHYRPCPVCGKPVEAKYLSDPARRCEECKGKGKITPKARVQAAAKQSLGFVAPTTSEPVPSDPNYINGPGVYTRTYVGPKSCGMIPTHVYTFEVMPYSLYGYDMKIMVDHTADEEVNLLFGCSSRISINQQFVVENR